MINLVEKLRYTSSKGISVWGDLQMDAAGAIEELTAERDTLRQQLAKAQRDGERYRFLRDNFATKSENSVDDFIALEPMTGEYFDAHIDILMSEFYATSKGATT
jgi:hypothetical protein